MTSLEGKKVLVTGGSRGIGAGIARSLAQQGAQVAITYTSRPEAGQEVLKSLVGEGHLCLKMNLRDANEIQATVKECLEKFGKIDALVNNAGITKDQLMLRMSEEDFAQVIDTNLKGTFLCTKSVLKPMMKAKGGSIVNVTSVIGQMGNAGQANYAASKAGIEAFTKSVAKELGSRNIRANCVAPGFIVTEMTEAMDDKQKEALLENCSLPRLGQVEDVAAAVAFLISEESAYITGQTIAVNGGLYM